jgi:predicted kinase
MEQMIGNNAKVLILVGIPGSGKSTVAKKFQEMYPDDKYTVINQDLLGSRQKCLDLMHDLLEQGKSVIIDRCNVNEEQRSHWIQAALYHGVKTITGIVLEVDSEEALARIHLRQDHPTIKLDMELDKKREIVSKFYNTYQPPRLSEGFSSVTFVRNQ